MTWAILIPSYHRAERLLYAQGQITLAYLHPSMRDHTFLFVRESEEEAYVPVAEKYGVGLLACSDHVNGIPETRDEMLSWAMGTEIKHLITMDDDLRLDYKPDSKTYKRMHGGEYFDRMIDDLIGHCDEEYPLTGITARQFSNNKTARFNVDTRIIQVACLYMPVWEKEKIWYSDFGIDFMTDYAFSIELMQRGYHNKCLNGYCRDDTMQAPGGCETYRTVDRINKSAVGLHKLYPDIVKPYVKQSGTWKERRVDVRVSWRKAYVPKQ